MGYDLHLTRADNWLDSGTNPIASEEWLKLIEEDAELNLLEGRDDDFFAYWLEQSEKGHYFCWRDGEVYTKMPRASEEVVGRVIRKMFELAEKLNAKVQGDNGESYELKGDGEIYYRVGDELFKFESPDDEKLEQIVRHYSRTEAVTITTPEEFEAYFNKQFAGENKPWWQRLFK